MHFFPVFHLFYVIQFENGILKLKQESWPTNEEKNSTANPQHRRCNMKFQKQKLLQQQQEKLDESKKLAREKNDSRSV